MARSSRVALLVAGILVAQAGATHPVRAQDADEVAKALDLTGGLFYRSADRYRERRSIILGMCRNGSSVPYIVSVTGHKRRVVEKVIRKHGPTDAEAAEMDAAWKSKCSSSPKGEWRHCLDSVPKKKS